MKRRDALKQTVFGSGAIFSLPLFTSVISGCSPAATNELAFTPQAFDKNQFSFLIELADTLIPRTDSPSASEAGVPEVIDGIVGECYAEADKLAYLNQFRNLQQFLENVEFSNSTSERQMAILQELENAGQDIRPAWLSVKQHIITTYLTAETIAENQLNYLPVPGTYEPCMPLSETNGKAWAI